jgi:hypothetical protein
MDCRDKPGNDGERTIAPEKCGYAKKSAHDDEERLLVI